MARASVPIREKLALRTDTSGGPDACWPWTGSKNKWNSPSINHEDTTRSARRILWDLEIGPVPEGYSVSDSCGRRDCMNPKHMRLRAMALVARFESFLDKSGGEDSCWTYQGGKYGWGYGFFSMGGAGKRRAAHRVAWELAHGAIPEGMVVMHVCDNPPCCNPKHLRLGTHQENMADMLAKGRAKHQPNRPRKPKVERAAQCPTCRRGFSARAHQQCIASRSESHQSSEGEKP